MAAYDYYWEKPCLIIDKDEESILFNKYAKIYSYTHPGPNRPCPDSYKNYIEILD
jgi:hypothetical protein